MKSVRNKILFALLLLAALSAACVKSEIDNPYDLKTGKGKLASYIAWIKANACRFDRSRFDRCVYDF